MSFNLHKEFATINISNDPKFNLGNYEQIFFTDLKHCLFYDEHELIVINVEKLKIILKIIHEKEKISLIKIIDSSTFSYILQCNSYNKINEVNIYVLNEYYELDVQKKIKDYICFNDPIREIKYTAIITNNFDLIIYKENIEKLKANILSSINTEQNENSPISNILKIQFFPRINNLVILTNNGFLISYKIYFAGNEYDTDKLECKDVQSIQSELEQIDSNFCLDLVENIFEFVSMQITEIQCEDNKEGNEENNQNQDIETLSHKNNNFMTIITISLNYKDNYSLISIYNINNEGLLIHYYTSSLFQHCIFYDTYICKRSKILDDNRVPKYWYAISKNKTNNSLEVFQFDLYVLLGIDENNNNDDVSNNNNQISSKNKQAISKILSDNNFEFSNLLKLVISNVSVNNFEKNFCEQRENYTVQIDLEILRIINEYQIYFSKYVLNYNTKDEFSNLTHTDKIYAEALTSDVNKYLKFYSKYRDSINIMTKFRQIIFDKLPKISDKGILNSNDKRLDPYLLFLILNKYLFSVKKYIGLRESKNYNQFLISNEVLNDTCIQIYLIIKSELKEKFNKISLETLNLYLSYVSIIIQAMKAIKSRYINNLDMFEIEKSIKDDEFIILNTKIFDMENVLLILKILLSIKGLFDEVNIFQKDFDSDIMKLLKDNPYFNLFNLKKSSTKNGFLVNNFYGYIYKYLNFDFLSDEMPSNLHELSYYTQFMLFLSYYYYVTYVTVKLDDDDIKVCNNIRYIDINHFRFLSKEYSEYSTLCYDIFLLDLNYLKYHIKGLNKNAQIMDIDISSFYLNNEIKNAIKNIITFLVHINQVLIKFKENNIFNEIPLIHQLYSLNVTLFETLFLEYLKYKTDNYLNFAFLITNSLKEYLFSPRECEIFIYILLEKNNEAYAFQFLTDIYTFYFNTLINDKVNDIIKENQDDYRNSNQLVVNKQNIKKKTISQINNEQGLLIFIIKSKYYKEIKNLYFILFDYIIKKGKIEFLFNTPFTLFQKILFKQFIIENKQYEELLVIYYIKNDEIRKAKKIFNEFKNKCSNYSFLNLYENIINGQLFMDDLINKKCDIDDDEEDEDEGNYIEKNDDNMIVDMEEDALHYEGQRGEKFQNVNLQINNYQYSDKELIEIIENCLEDEISFTKVKKVNIKIKERQILENSVNLYNKIYSDNLNISSYFFDSQFIQSLFMNYNWNQMIFGNKEKINNKKSEESRSISDANDGNQNNNNNNNNSDEF